VGGLVDLSHKYRSVSIKDHIVAVKYRTVQ